MSWRLDPQNDRSGADQHYVGIGKGRVHCRQPGFEMLNGHRLDEKGCIQPEGMPEEQCKPSEADYQVSGTEYFKFFSSHRTCSNQ